MAAGIGSYAGTRGIGALLAVRTRLYRLLTVPETVYRLSPGRTGREMSRNAAENALLAPGGVLQSLETGESCGRNPMFRLLSLPALEP